MATLEDIPLYPPISAYESGFLKVDDTHELYWEIAGNPNGVPVVFLHGGPGGCISPTSRQFFDPQFYKIILFDQRGGGKSKPSGSIESNTTQDLVNDIEKIRTFLNIEKWHIFGNSWGTTLALCYAIQHKQRCLNLIIEGVFFMRRQEIDWFMNGMGTIFPEAHDRFRNYLPVEEQNDLLKGYYKRLTCGDLQTEIEAGMEWSRYESACAFLIPREEVFNSHESRMFARAISRIEAHYFIHNQFEPDTYIEDNLHILKGLPISVIQGRYDIICPPHTALLLKKALPSIDFVMVNLGGHSKSDPGIRTAIIKATKRAQLLPVS